MGNIIMKYPMAFGLPATVPFLDASKGWLMGALVGWIAGLGALDGFQDCLLSFDSLLVGTPLVVTCGPFGGSGYSFGHFGALSGLPQIPFGLFWASHGPCLGPSWTLLGPLLASLGVFLGSPGVSWAPPGRLWSFIGFLVLPSGAFGVHWGASGPPFGCRWA